MLLAAYRLAHRGRRVDSSQGQYRATRTSPNANPRLTLRPIEAHQDPRSGVTHGTT
jgi:hypothetical protein